MARAAVTPGGLLQAAAAVTAVVSLVTLGNSLHHDLELLAHFRLQYLVVSGILAALLCVVRHRRWAVVMAAVTLVNAALVLPWYRHDAASPAAGAATVTILLANVNSRNREAGRLIELLGKESPDIVFLQEITERWLQALTPVFAAYPYRLAVPRDDNFGIAVLSRQPFVEMRTVDSPPYGFPTIVAVHASNDKTVTYVSTHPMPPVGESNFAGRNEQYGAVADLITAIDGPVVLAGDLNTTMWGHAYRDFVTQTGLVNTRAGFGILPTWPTHLPFAMIPIDHCLVSAELAVVEVRTTAAIGSDHLPYVVTLTF